MENKNGHTDPGPPFAVIGAAVFNVMPKQQVIESIEANAIQQAKLDLKMGPYFRKVADDFREFARVAEPGQLFQAPEAELRIIRMSAFSPPATSLSEAKLAQIKAAQEGKEAGAGRIIATS